MGKEDLIKQCRFYKGENECPFTEDGYHRAMLFWKAEKEWVEDPTLENSEETKLEYLHLCEDYWKDINFMQEHWDIRVPIEPEQFYDLMKNDGVPRVLKGNILTHFADEFAENNIETASNLFPLFYTFFYLGIGKKPFLFTEDTEEEILSESFPYTWEEWVARERK